MEEEEEEEETRIDDYQVPLLEDHIYMGSCNKLEIKYEDFQVPHVKIFTLGTIYTMVELRFETPNLSVFGYTGNVFSWSSCGALSLSEANLHFCSAPKI